jgi:hypothetical protein
MDGGRRHAALGFTRASLAVSRNSRGDMPNVDLKCRLK